MLEHRILGKGTEILQQKIIRFSRDFDMFSDSESFFPSLGFYT